MSAEPRETATVHNATERITDRVEAGTMGPRSAAVLSRLLPGVPIVAEGPQFDAIRRQRLAVLRQFLDYPPVESPVYAHIAREIEWLATGKTVHASFEEVGDLPGKLHIAVPLAGDDVWFYDPATTRRSNDDVYMGLKVYVARYGAYWASMNNDDVKRVEDFGAR